MTTFFTSDHHFGHANIIKHCERPFNSVSEMNEELVRRWNAVVKPGDIVFYLGDFCWRSGAKKFLERLNGSVVWVRGNHDKATVINDVTAFVGGRYWHLVHDPSNSDFEAVIHGHVHKMWKVKRDGGRLLVNVGVDVWDYAPVSLSRLLKAVEAFKKSREDVML